MCPLPTYQVAGISITASSTSSAVEMIVAASTAGRPLAVHLCNAYTISLVEAHLELKEALTSGDLNLPDGTPVAWLGRKFGVRGPVRGPSLVDAVAQASVMGTRHYLYGAGPGVAEKMRDALAARYPQFHAAAVESPPYDEPTDLELQQLAERVEASGANIVWIGMGTPRQDYIVARLAGQLHCPVIAVGAAFDYLGGNLKPAPKMLHGSGFEWLYRLLQEPKRLWRRYTLGTMRFCLAVVRSASHP